MMYDELIDDEIRAAEYRLRCSQRCVDCRRSWWVQPGLTTKSYNDHVLSDGAGIGFCVIEGDPLSVMGITTEDTAASAVCDMFEAADR